MSASYSYDALGRMTAMDAQSGGRSVLKTTIGYNDPSSTTATGQVRTWKNGKTTYSYFYDAKGNISSIDGDGESFGYYYDARGQLIRVENETDENRYLYAYDAGGNILRKTLVDYSGDRVFSNVIATYTYGDESWPDLLTAYNGKAITYDGIGNPLSDSTWTYTWQHGRQLAGMNKAGTDISYRYDADGLRIAKTVNGTTYNYFYLGDQLTEMTWGSNKLHFTYDSTGPLSVSCNGTEYFYVRNAQGDVTGLVSTGGTRVVSYTYIVSYITALHLKQQAPAE